MRRSFAVAGLLGLLAGLPARAATPSELFESGNAAYKEGRYEDAARAYETILEYGVVDPRVLYNLGNASFKLGHIGPAILQYERALRLSPNDRETRENLELARGRIRDRPSEPELQYPIRVVKQVIDRLPIDPLAWTFLGFYFAAGGLLAGVVLSRSWMRRRLLAYSALLLGLLALTAGAALLYSIRQASADVAIVMRDKVDVLSGPGEKNTPLFTVHEGTRMELGNRVDQWVQVSLPNGLSGWVPKAAVEQV